MNTGSGGNPGGCPATAPTPGGACTNDGTAVCNYPGGSCACRDSGGTTVWTCLFCPAFEPPNNSACTPPPGTVVGGIVCPYGNQFCACMSAGTWYCRCMGCP